ncbi:MAG: efflux RND transporter periplasmic adaptor subunit [Gemmobacter sp.]
MLSLLRQVVIGLILLAATLFLWVRYVPSAVPVLDRYGVLAPVEALGFPVSRPPEGAPRGGPGGPPGGGAPVVVIAAPPGDGVMNDTVTAIGTGQAIRSVVVVPEVSGRVVELAVSSGDRVEAGQVLARLEAEAERIAAERAALVRRDAEDRVERLSRLQGSGVATDVQARDADLALRQAELALEQARFELDRRTIRAPIGGWVGIVDAEIGKQLTQGTSLLRIDDRSALLVEFRVPERLVGLVGAGDRVVARALARSDRALEGVVTAVDNRVDEASRTLRMQARIDNTDDRLRAGMSFSISLDLPGEVLPSVDPLSVQWGREGAYVWVIRDDRAVRLPIRIMQREADAVLVRAGFEAGDQVVIEGVQALRPGIEARVRPPGGRPGDRGERRDAAADPAASRL